jgi:hypothetical protein
MSGVNQAVFMNQRSFGPPAIGSAYEGGFFAGQISTSGNGVATHNLVVAPVSSGDSQAQWKNVLTSSSNALSDIDGPQNTADIVAQGSSTVYPAAYFCDTATIGGFTDWYMPAKNELEVCYYNLKPTTASNNTNSGTNTNAVPSRGSNYTSGTPAQTAAADFKSTGAEDFVDTDYWVSTRHTTFYARKQRFDTGYQGFNGVTNTNRVRAVRRVAI